MFYQNIISKLQYFLIFTIATFLFSCTKGKGAICNDGWRSHSIGSGTCSWHGGIDHYIDPNEIDSFKILCVMSVFRQISCLTYQA